MNYFSTSESDVGDYEDVLKAINGAKYFATGSTCNSSLEVRQKQNAISLQGAQALISLPERKSTHDRDPRTQEGA